MTDAEQKVRDIVAGVNTLVFDFETPSLQRDAGILSIGGFMFDRFSVENTKAAMDIEMLNFTVNINLTEQFFLGLHISQETGKWWNTKNKDQIPHVTKNQISIHEAIPQFVNWIDSAPKLHPFCRHTHADYIWLENVCEVLKIKNPVRYNRVYDVASAVFQATGEEKGYILTDMKFDNHNALGDCQRDGLQLAMINDNNYKIPTEFILGRS